MDYRITIVAMLQIAEGVKSTLIIFKAGISERATRGSI